MKEAAAAAEYAGHYCAGSALFALLFHPVTPPLQIGTTASITAAGRDNGRATQTGTKTLE
jgi:hypothetical protein